MSGEGNIEEVEAVMPVQRPDFIGYFNVGRGIIEKPSAVVYIAREGFESAYDGGSELAKGHFREDILRQQRKVFGGVDLLIAMMYGSGRKGKLRVVEAVGYEGLDTAREPLIWGSERYKLKIAYFKFVNGQFVDLSGDFQTMHEDLRAAWRAEDEFRRKRTASLARFLVDRPKINGKDFPDFTSNRRN